MMDCSTRHPEAVLDIAGLDGNAFAVLAATRRCLLNAGVSRDEVEEFFAEATSGNYDRLLQTMMSWVIVTDSSVDDD